MAPDDRSTDPRTSSASSQPVSPQFVTSIRQRLENRYFEGDVVWVSLRNKSHPGSVMEVPHIASISNGPFNTQHDPHNLGLDPRIRLQESLK
ncbi:hypothetical protein HGRIS_011988 [Hohenbuehelia grisea]|uniref:HNH endonuclease n=1 Tax=Hohenbuehelia grisea TaxID=104357 RepID=A0ABR3JWQ3_9AGAR